MSFKAIALSGLVSVGAGQALAHENEYLYGYLTTTYNATGSSMIVAAEDSIIMTVDRGDLNTDSGFVCAQGTLAQALSAIVLEPKDVSERRYDPDSARTYFQVLGHPEFGTVPLRPCPEDPEL